MRFTSFIFIVLGGMHIYVIMPFLFSTHSNKNSGYNTVTLEEDNEVITHSKVIALCSTTIFLKYKTIAVIIQ